MLEWFIAPWDPHLKFADPILCSSLVLLRTYYKLTISRFVLTTLIYDGSTFKIPYKNEICCRSFVTRSVGRSCLG
jgi:hypothetical protein